ncbi:uncharacterized protein BYT42DRAFT_565055 [Radiomyces spectabilis]|uniref:uncharacterized protein n=1 Tax=Radiomyces spectabilis TaxID=64574 RepID=UPI002220EF02|nr:uncharacterized protein BYT42DRAFT_565055 [Radiomyces spectabilis]KAI8381044.1 hypothetical protein BYT42DRAFT_565055 [Radiomyces spectabilis]
MSGYLIAVWDYTAEGEFELSFKQGDRIKLLEKHNDDWWEGELNDEIGFFPANRIRLETEAEQQQQNANTVMTGRPSSGIEHIHRDTPPPVLPARPADTMIGSSFPHTNDNLSANHRQAHLFDYPDESPSHFLDTLTSPPADEVSLTSPQDTSHGPCPLNLSPPRETPPSFISLPEQRPAGEPNIHLAQSLVERSMSDPTDQTSHEALLVDISDEPPRSKTSIPDALPDGWQHAYDNDGTIYYFNEQTGESRWDRPHALEAVRSPMSDKSPLGDDLLTNFGNLMMSPPEMQEDADQTTDLANSLQKLNAAELKQLELDHLHSEWIRQQGFVQMKMIAEKGDGEKLSSWKMYYAVLSSGFLIFYKEGPSKNRKSSKPLLPVGSFDLDACQIDPAGKHDTRRKYVFLITTPRKVKIYIQTANEKEFSSWLDAIMRELIARKEGQNQNTEILQLLKRLTYDSQQMKVNRKYAGVKKDQEDRDRKLRSSVDKTDGKPKMLGHWFNKSGGGKADVKPRIQPVRGQAVSSAENDVFGGYLHLESDGRIPRIIQLCIQEVEARGLESVGIYRLSGPSSAIQKYRQAFNRHEPVSLVDEPDINVATGLLKLYFRELRNPLLTFEYYDWFIEAARIPDYDERMFRIKSIIHVLPKDNYIVLEYLMRHLNLVASYSDINKMETSNLALIFSVGLLRSCGEDLSSIMHTDLQSKVVEAIIQQVDWFFELDQEPQESQEHHE